MLCARTESKRGVDLKVADKKALITGGSSGIGLL
jgi:hypothetical protein